MDDRETGGLQRRRGTAAGETGAETVAARARRRGRGAACAKMRANRLSSERCGAGKGAGDGEQNNLQRHRIGSDHRHNRA